MKRRVIRVMLFLLLGAIVNVAVAWGATVYPIRLWAASEFDSNPNLEQFADAGWKASVRDWDAYTFIIGTQRAWGVQWNAFWESGFPPLPQGFGSSTNQTVPIGVSVESGWPQRALGGLRLANGEQWGAIGLKDEVLPCRPIWPGFAINTLFYAAILWLLFAAPFALRQRRRIKRGLCPACAYPVGESDVCTECGKPVTALNH